jgi:hydrogenase/urease accessory protein HupE
MSVPRKDAKDPQSSPTTASKTIRPMITKTLEPLKRPAVATFFLFFLAGVAQAHDPGLSAINLSLGSSRAAAHFSIARIDVENALRLKRSYNGLTITDDTVEQQTRMEAFGKNAIELTIDDQPLTTRSLEIQAEESGALVFEIIYDSHPGSRLKIISRTLNLLQRGHRQYLSVVDEQGNKLSEKVLDAADCQLEIALSSITKSNTRLQFVHLGIEHILTGYDHLVFLLGLLIAGARFKDISKIITSFTVAHSVTLVLSTLDLVRISPSIVEPLIAVSIVYVGLENIFRRELKWRWLVTFAFGLIHGFGFASALRDLGIGSGVGAALSLISFNAGVEVGQLTVAVVALPIIWILRRRQMFVTRLVPACSLIISVAGAMWLFGRLFG